MDGWRYLLKADPVPWLLEEDNPSVRYLTLTGILGRPESDPEVTSARAAIMSSGPVPLILSKQEEGGWWGKAADFYIRSKYRGTVWSLILLAELGADGRDPRVRGACEFILDNAQDRESGGFAYLPGPGGGGDRDKILPCLTGNMAWSLARLGYGYDPRVRQAAAWIAKYQRFDDGIDRAPSGWPWEGAYRCYGRHTCHMGVIKALKALAAIPPGSRYPEVRDAIARGVEYFLKHRLFKCSHNLRRVAKYEWKRFGFPLMWRTDALEMLGVLAALGCRDERMQEAVDLVVSKQDERGRWPLESSLNGRMLCRFEHDGKPSKWATLRAIKALHDAATWIRPNSKPEV